MWYLCPSLTPIGPHDADWGWAVRFDEDPKIPIFDILVETDEHKNFYEREKKFWAFDGTLHDDWDPETDGPYCYDCDQAVDDMTRDQWYEAIRPILAVQGWLPCPNNAAVCADVMFVLPEDVEAHVESFHEGQHVTMGDPGLPIFDANLQPLLIPPTTTHEAW